MDSEIKLDIARQNRLFLLPGILPAIIITGGAPILWRYTKKETVKRKYELMLQLPVNKEFSVDEILLLTPEIAKKSCLIKLQRKYTDNGKKNI